MEDKIMLFIDGSNVHHASKKVGIKVDYKKLVDVLLAGKELRRAYYYGSIPIPPNPKQVKFIHALKYLGFTTRINPLKVRASGRKVEKGTDSAIVCDLLNLARMDAFDRAIIVSGDRDFVKPTQSLKEMGKIVEVASFAHCFCAELKREADSFVVLDEIKNKIKFTKKKKLA